MMWSKLQRTIESLLADSVQKHLQVHLTRYGSGDTFIMNRAWVVWDGQEVSTFSTIRWMNEREALAAQLSGDGKQRVHYECFAQAEEILEQREMYACESFLAALETYTSLSIEQAMNSSNTLIRAWSAFDRRLGKRRLRAMRFHENDLKLRHYWYQLRCEAENITGPEIPSIGSRANPTWL